MLLRHHLPHLSTDTPTDPPTLAFVSPGPQFSPTQMEVPESDTKSDRHRRRQHSPVPLRPSVFPVKHREIAHSSVCHPAVHPSFISLASIHHLRATPIRQCPTVTRRDIPAHARPFNPPICQFPGLNHILSLHHDLSHTDQM